MYEFKNHKSNGHANGNGSGNGNGNGKGNGNGHSNGHVHADPIATMEAKLTSADFLRAFELDYPEVDTEAIEDATAQILRAVGEDPDREGLLRTPHRVAGAYKEILAGYRVNPKELINNAIFDVEYDEMVIVNDIEYYSLCEHHMLPFLGKAHVAYIPGKKVIGLSKIPRIVDMFSQRLQVQERLTRQIADFINEVLEPRGVAVVMDGKHMCSMIRGVHKCYSGMTTSAMIGEFRDNPATRAEFMAHINRTNGSSMF